MQTDHRIQFIIDVVNQAAKEIAPDAPPLTDSDETTKNIIALGLKIFDALLPMLVSAVVVEYRNQVKPT